MGGRDHSARADCPESNPDCESHRNAHIGGYGYSRASGNYRYPYRQAQGLRLLARLQDRAKALGGNLTRTELEVISKFIEGRSPETIAEERGLSERTISNQLRTGCHKLGFSDRRELKGWAIAVTGFLLTQPTRD
jgi:DNA-binding CsgD family transcriptional regulator